MNKKKIILIGLIVIIVLVLILCCQFFNNVGNSNVINNSTISNGEFVESVELPTIYIEEEKTYETLTFSNIRIVEKNEKENLLRATVRNNGVERFDSKVIDVELFRENGTSIGILGCLIPNIEAESLAEIEISIAANVMNTANIKMIQSGN